ncbi:hypothetical protein [Mesorhizobium sp. 43Arga]
MKITIVGSGHTGGACPAGWGHQVVCVHAAGAPGPSVTSIGRQAAAPHRWDADRIQEEGADIGLIYGKTDDVQYRHGVLS